VHRELAAELRSTAAELDEDADLVPRRMRVAFHDRAVDGREPGRAGHDDVFSELAGERHPLLIEALLRPDALGLDRLEHLLREREELVVVGDRLGLAADGDDRAALAVVGDSVADLSLGRLAPSALGGAGQALLAQQDFRALDVAVRLLERALALHHRRSGEVAQFLDERR